MARWPVIWGVFGAALLVFAVIYLPPVLVLENTLKKNDVEYGVLSGSLFDLELSQASIAGFPVQRLNISTSPSSLFWGSPSFEGRFSAAGSAGSFAASLDGETLHFRSLRVVQDIAARSRFGVLTGSVSLQSQNAVISLVTGCQSGQFVVGSDILGTTLSSFGIEVASLVGTAICDDDGVMLVEMRTESGDIRISVTGRVVTRQNWSDPRIELTYFLSPKEDEAFPQVLISRLESAGLQRSGSGFAGRLALAAQ